MRDLTKSVTSYTWAMSVFWTQQMFNFFGLGGSGSWNRSSRAFNNVTEATANEMGDTMRAVFRSGDTLQRGVVDLLLAPFSFGNWCGTGGDRDDGRRGAEAYADRDRGRDRDRDRDRMYYDTGRGADYAENGRAGWSDRSRGGGWVDTAARAAAAGVDVMQAAVDTTARAARRTTEAVTPPPPRQPSAPQASDPSLGWGPMPR